MEEQQITGTLSINTATQSEEKQVIDSIILAFSADPCVRWLYPEAHQYLKFFSEFIKAFGGKAFHHKTAYYSEEFSGAALWLPVGIQPDENLLVSLIQKSVEEERLETVFSIMEQMGNFHPNEPHWHLPLIGVDPAHQRKGIGSDLMSHTLTLCDEENAIAYLEATNPENISLYKRHGFEVLGAIQAGNSPTLTPMLRKPGNS